MISPPAYTVCASYAGRSFFTSQSGIPILRLHFRLGNGDKIGVTYALASSPETARYLAVRLKRTLELIAGRSIPWSRESDAPHKIIGSMLVGRKGTPVYLRQERLDIRGECK